MKLRRTARRHKTAVDSTLWGEFQPGDRVLTVEGFMGTVTAVEDGPVAGDEQYLVELDAGMGGGEYSSEELTGVSGSQRAANIYDPGAYFRPPDPAPSGIPEAGAGGVDDLASDPMLDQMDDEMQMLASEDYPELVDVLIERPPLAHAERVAMRTMAVGYQPGDVVQYRRVGTFRVIEGPIDTPQNFVDLGQGWYLVEAVKAPKSYRDKGQIKLWFSPPTTETREMFDQASLVPVRIRRAAGYIVEDENGQVVAGPFVSRLDAESAERDARDEGQVNLVIRREGAKPESGDPWWLTNFLYPLAQEMNRLQPADVRYDFETGRGASYDWCRFRHNRRCHYPRRLNQEATREVGYTVWVPEDRGFCPYEKWDGPEGQRSCPVSEPGPNADPSEGPMADATIPWERGGQRYDSNGIPIKVGAKEEVGPGTYFILEEAPLAFTLVDENYNFAGVVSRVEAEAAGHRDELLGNWILERSVARIAARPDQSVEEMAEKKDPEHVDFLEDLVEVVEHHRERRNPYTEGDNPYMANWEFSFHFTATWADVQAKAKRIKDDGYVRIISASPAYLVGEVRGDTNIYQSTLHHEPGSKRIAMWECFLPDAPVLMEDGTERRIADIQPGDRVITHEGNVRMVVRAESKPYDGEVVRLQFRGDVRRELVATANHEVWAANRDYGLVGRDRYAIWKQTGSTITGLQPTMGWTEIGELGVGDYLSRSYLIEESPLLVLVGGVEVKVEQELATWLGWYAAEGYCIKSDPNRVGFSLGGKEDSVCDLLDDIALRYVGVTGIRRYLDTDGCVTERDGASKIDYRVSHPVLRGLAEALIGTGARSKVLASGMLTLPLDIQRAFIEAWVAGDGHIEGRGVTVLDSASESLIRQAREIVSRLGIVSNVRRVTAKNSGGFPTTQNAGELWRLAWSQGRNNLSQFRRDGSFWHKITDVKRERYQGEVWDIEVEGDHSFRAYGMNVHNCGCAWASYSWGRSGRWKKYEGRMCVTPDTMISMADGTFKEVDQVEVGDWVVTHNGVGPVEQIIITDGYAGDLYEIKSTGYHLPLRITGNHEVWGYGTPDRLRKSWQDVGGQGFKFYDESFLLDQNPSWIDVDQMRVHDWLTGPIRSNTFGGFFDLSAHLTEMGVSHEVDEDDRVWTTYLHGGHASRRHESGGLSARIFASTALMDVIGLYLAEGNFDVKRTEIQWTVHEEEVDLVKRLQGALDELGAGQLRIYQRPEVTRGISLRLTNRPLAYLLHALAESGSRSKALHPWVMMLGPEWQGQLLDAYWMGDGTQSDSRRKFNTASDQLAQQVYDLLVRCGHLPSWSRNEQGGGPTNREDRFTINNVSYVPDPRYVNGRRTNGDGYYSTKIKSVKSEWYEGQVYNLKVTGDESYVANGRIIHNCSHALALQYEGQSRGMFNREIAEDIDKPIWQSDPSITVKVPGDYKKPPIGEWRLSSKSESLNDSPAIAIGRELLGDGYAPGKVLAMIEGMGAINAPTILNQLMGIPMVEAGVDDSLPNTLRDGRPASVVRIDSHRAREMVTRVIGVENMEEWVSFTQGHVWLIATSEISKLDDERGRWMGSVKVMKRPPTSTGWVKTWGSKVAQADTTGVMVALVPPQEILEQIVLDEEGAEPIDQLHVTVAYLGDIEEVHRANLELAVSEWASRWDEMTGTLAGYGVFENGEKKVLYISVDVPGLDRARDDLVDVMAGLGIVPADDHGFTPHMTLKYGDFEIPEGLPEGVKEEFTFAHVTMAYGGEWMDIPFRKEAAHKRIVEKAKEMGVERVSKGRHIAPTTAEEAEAWLDWVREWLGTFKLGPKAQLERYLEQVDEALAGGWGPKVQVLIGVILGLIGQMAPHLLGVMESELKEEPEPALPSTTSEEEEDGEIPKPEWVMNDLSKEENGDMNIAEAARGYLKKEGLKNFTPAERRTLIEEGEGVVAANLDQLDIVGTHYESLEEAYQMLDEEWDI